MGLALEKVRAVQHTITVPFSVGEETENITVTYTPSGLTPNVLAPLRDLAKDNFAITELSAEILSVVLVSWDVTTGGEMYPLDVDSLKDLDGQILISVVEAVTEDAQARQAAARKRLAPVKGGNVTSIVSAPQAARRPRR